MLTELRIRNFALIESLSLPLGRGFNVLSGETGAGKSIIVGALGLLLGERGSTDLVRTGADRATVEGVFEIHERPEIAALLDDRGIDMDEQLVVLKREVAAAGRTRAWVNGTPVTAGQLAEVGRLLVNLHGQHEAQTLLDPQAQRGILDAFAGATELAAEVRSQHDSWSAVRREIATLDARRADAEKRADYLRHVAQEIEEAKLTQGEDARLEEDARRLENVEELRSLCGGIQSALEAEDEGTLHRLAAIGRQLSSLQRLDPSLVRLQEGYDAAHYALEGLAREIEEYQTGLELDPARLEDVRRRRDVIFRLTRKHGPEIADVLRAGREARAELDLLDSGGLDRVQLERRESEAHARLLAASARLTERRAEAARRLASAVDELLPSLGMNDGRLQVLLSPLPEPGAHGAEDAEFLVALNAGHDARPLSRVASGGELSRVMLALKTILARLDRVPTLVFDEVDAGIGGRVGLQVGDTLRRVAEYHQVFAITHLPQIAARAHHHMLVAKSTTEGVTSTDVAVLEGNGRVAEIARMLGGDPESDVSRAHARELMASADAAAVPESGAMQRARVSGGGRAGSRRSAGADRA